MTLARLGETVLIRNWWAVVLRGVVTVLFGLLALTMPGVTLAALIILFGVYSLVDGAFAILSVVRKRFGGYWWAVLLQGIVSVAAGVFTLVWPGITAIVLLYVIAFWAIVTGILQIIGAIRLRKVIRGEWLLVIGGILSIVLGLVLFARPLVGVLAVVFWIGIYAILAGLMITVLGFRMRGIYKDVRSA